MPFEPPSTYAPFFRRFFGNEKKRETQELLDLYRWVYSYQAHVSENPESLCGKVLNDFFDIFDDYLTRPVALGLHHVVSLEEHIWSLPPPYVERMTLQEFVEYRNLLYEKQRFLANQDHVIRQLYEGVVRLFYGVVRDLPELENPSPFSIPLIYALPDPRQTVGDLIPILSDYYDLGLFKHLSERMVKNLYAASGRNPEDQRSNKPLIPATESTLPLDQLASTYLRGTPFLDLFAAPVPLKLTHEDRFSHMHVVGGSGAGKTTLIENLIRHDLEADELTSIVLIDPHSDLVRKLMRSDLGIADRLILIDPRDTNYPAALNPFALNKERLASYDDATREQVTAGVIQTMGYLWNGLTNLTLTGKQEVLFRYVTRLLLSLPQVENRNATILDMLRLMSNPEEYQKAIDALPDIPREFFKTDFRSKTFDGTKEQIRYRIQAIIESPTMARLFTAPETKIDLFAEMNRGAIILVDTAKDFLKEGSAVFGKLMISLVLQAVLERAALPAAARRPTFIMIDEAGSFFSSNIDDLLTEARKYKAGLVLAHQYLDQATSSLRASLAANTAIKFASGLSAQDASSMARDMRTTPDFILGQPKLQFAAHIRHVTPQAVSIPIHYATDTRLLSEDEYARIIERNRERVSFGPAPPVLPPPIPELAHQPQPASVDEDIDLD